MSVFPPGTYVLSLLDNDRRVILNGAVACLTVGQQIGQEAIHGGRAAAYRVIRILADSDSPQHESYDIHQRTRP